MSSAPRLPALREALAAVEAASADRTGAPEEEAKLWCALQGYVFRRVTALGSVVFLVDGVGHEVHAPTKDIPHYWRSLDAAVPGENVVVSMRLTSGKWHAQHAIDNEALIQGEAATEILARRAAGLRGLVAKEEANES